MHNTLLFAALVITACIVIFASQKFINKNDALLGEYTIVSRMHPNTLTVNDNQVFAILHDGASYRIKTVRGDHCVFDELTGKIVTTRNASDLRGLFTLTKQTDGAYTLFNHSANAVIIAEQSGYSFVKTTQYFPDQGFDIVPV